jgi:hypothetical protein
VSYKDQPAKKQRLPNFFLAGASKAGTTSLYHHLAQHSYIYMSPVKEPTYFADQLESLFSHFPRNQVGIWLYEDTLREPQQFRRQVFEFLDVDPEFRPETRKRYYQMEIPRALPLSQALRRSGAWRGVRRLMPTKLVPPAKKLLYRRPGAMCMSASERAFLVNYCGDDIRRLDGVLDRDLSGWLQ